MTDDEIMEARKLCDGFKGRFVFDPAHYEDRGIGRIAEVTTFDDRLMYVPDGSELRDDDCHMIADQIDAHVMKALAGVLNAAPRLLDEVELLRRALTKISAIRDSIVGMQGFNFSEHAYPLVAALDEAGFSGAGYEISRANLGTLIQQRDAAMAIANRIADAAAHCRSCRECGDGPCCDHCDVEAATAALASEPK